MNMASLLRLSQRILRKLRAWFTILWAPRVGQGGVWWEDNAAVLWWIWRWRWAGQDVRQSWEWEIFSFQTKLGMLVRVPRAPSSSLFLIASVWISGRPENVLAGAMSSWQSILPGMFPSEPPSPARPSCHWRPRFHGLLGVNNHARFSWGRFAHWLHSVIPGFG